LPVTITHADVAELCTGSVFLATGGGGDPYVSQLLVEQALREFGPVTLTALDSVPDDALVVAIGEVGAPTVSLEQLPIGTECLEVVDRFEAFTGKKITHIVSFEVGGANSVIPLIAAAAKGIPLIDGDGMGRALPEAQMMTFAIEGVCPTPAVAVDYTGGAVYFDTRDTLIYERQVRNIAMAMGGMVFTAEHPMTGVEAKRAIVPGTISFALALGRELARHKGSAKDAIPRLEALFATSDYGVLRHLYTGKIVDIDRRIVGGFDVGAAVIDSLDAAEPPMTLTIKNEFLVAMIGERVVASVPDLITMVDHETAQPINSERVHYGQRVSVFGVGCPPHYRTARALKVVGPRVFGFDFDFVPIESLATP
jgi:hypothetical protein